MQFMKQQQQNIRNKNLFKYSSTKKYLKIFVPDFAFKHDNDDARGKDKFVGREVQFRRLYTWLTSDSKSGSYLITGYRGMGKSLLVKRVIEVITREPRAYKEIIFLSAAVCIFLSGFAIANEDILTRWEGWVNPLKVALPILAVILVLGIHISKIINQYWFEKGRRKLPNYHLFDKEFVSKFFVKRKDRRERRYEIMSISINLGQEVLHERDVLSIMAQNIYDKYHRFVYNRQNKPFLSLLVIGGGIVASCLLTYFVYVPFCEGLGGSLLHAVDKSNSYLGELTRGLLKWIKYLKEWEKTELFFYLLFYLGSLFLTIRLFKSIRKLIPYYSTPFKALDNLKLLCDRIDSTIHEETGAHPRYNSSFFTISVLGEGKNKITPMANVREIEQELLSIINSINGEDCPKPYRAQFVIVFDELDKITKAANKETGNKEDNGKDRTPDFDTSVDGFTDAMAYEERKQNVLRLLANMKLFISTVNAKCIFISGHELFDASMADLSDREFAINSIFNGVLNVSSFLSPEGGEKDISSMTELYVATMLIPEDYLVEKICKNASSNYYLKEEQPSLRWYYEYLMDKHVRNAKGSEENELNARKAEIMYAVEFLRYFTVFLSHISNGSPKKIATYFEKYIKTNYDAIKQFEWHDEIVVGVPSEKEVRKQCVLYFDPTSQKLINFIYYLASPVMNAITNEVSNYGDKLLVSSSFILDQIYKYHGKGFSWRNLEQMPELLTSTKNPELRDSMASIVEFLLQVHITNISSGIFQFKFHKQISEEISTLSKISEEASAIFNFTLNESEAVKRYNTRLLSHYLTLAASKPSAYVYKDVLERLHENQGDIFFSEEDYYRAIHEYRSALQYIPQIKGKETARDVLSYLKCSLKIGMSYEYRRTYENAYMMYCSIINKLIQLHWIEEKELGLDYTMRLTRDWRLKQTVLIDQDCLKYKCGFNSDPQFRREFNSGLWEDLNGRGDVRSPYYSLDADKTISGLSALYTPEKSNLFERLTAFEDVKYVYQAIIAKLFVIEKMQVSGITQSSIEEAEAEFMTLYSDTNIDEKFMVAADFFGKMGEILYYKNNYVISYRSENLAAALYRFDINVLGLLDDYCFATHSSGKCIDAIAVKDHVRLFFDIIKLEDLTGVHGNDDSVDFKDLFFEANGGHLVFRDDLLKGGRLKNRLCGVGITGEDKYKSFCNDVKGYLEYIREKDIFHFYAKWSKIQDCSRRITKLSDVGYKLPCNACKYINRSLIILMKNMFRDDDAIGADFEKGGKAVVLLEYTSHKHLRHLRQSQVSLLASKVEQLANIILSCSSTDMRLKGKVSELDSEISVEVVDLLVRLSREDVDEDERKWVLANFKKQINAKEKTADSTHLSKLDKVLLYYWAAYRYYVIASMHKEAEQCIERVAKVLEDYLLAINFDKKKEKLNERLKIVNRLYGVAGRFELIENLFKNAAVAVGRQYDNFDMAEIHENKWLFHMERADDVDLVKLSIFPNLQSVFNTAVRCKLLCMQYLYQKERNADVEEAYKNYLVKIYNRVAPSLRHEKTFRGEVESYYMKVWLNHLVLHDVLGGEVLRPEREACMDGVVNPNLEHHKVFYEKLKNFLSPNDKESLYQKIFRADGSVRSKLEILNFLVYDSMVCLTNVLKTLTPHNHITTFSNSFVAEIYDMLWEWSKYYELLYDLYIYYRYEKEGNVEGRKAVVKMSSRNTGVDNNELETLMKNCVALMDNEGISYKDAFGYLYSKLLLNLRHDMDDATIHHIYTNYSAEMAIKYYRMARDINSEGLAYKNLIGNMYILNDDLHNDTCQFNLADERYMLNSGLIYSKRRELEKMYEQSNVNKISSFEKAQDETDAETLLKMLRERFDDSLYINTEY